VPHEFFISTGQDGWVLCQAINSLFSNWSLAAGSFGWTKIERGGGGKVFWWTHWNRPRIWGEEDVIGISALVIYTMNFCKILLLFLPCLWFAKTMLPLDAHCPISAKNILSDKRTLLRKLNRRFGFGKLYCFERLHFPPRVIHLSSPSEVEWSTRYLLWPFLTPPCLDYFIRIPNVPCASLRFCSAGIYPKLIPLFLQRHREENFICFGVH